MSGTAPPASMPLDRRATVTFLLERFKDAVPGVLVAELATTDGFPLAMVDMDQASAERLAAVGAGMHSLGRGVGPALGRDRKSHLKQAFFETDTERVFSMSAAEGSLLTVVTSLDADPGLTGHEMTVLVQGVRPHLATPTRSATVQTAGDEQ